MKTPIPNNLKSPNRRSPITRSKVQALRFDPEDPFANLDDPDYYDDNGIYTTRYQDAIINRLATGSNTEFDTSMPCKVCERTGHTFDNCPILNNTPFLRRHYISMKLHLSQQRKREQEAMSGPDAMAAVNKMEEEEIDFTQDPDGTPDTAEDTLNFQSEGC